MNRNDIIGKMADFRFDTSEYLISTGAAMVLHGIRPLTHDIDIGCSQKLWDELVSLGYEVISLPGGGEKLRFSDDIELSKFLFRGNSVTIDSLPVADLQSIIEMKRALGREKDFRDIALIEKFMSEDGAK